MFYKKIIGEQGEKGPRGKRGKRVSRFTLKTIKNQTFFINWHFFLIKLFWFELKQVVALLEKGMIAHVGYYIFLLFGFVYKSIKTY